MLLLENIKTGKIPEPFLIEALEEDYRNLDVSQREEVWRALNEFFKNQGITDLKLIYSYWRWYVDLTWLDLNIRDEDFLAKTVFARQIPMAILLDYDVWEKLMAYLQIITVDRADMEGLYAKIRDGFFNSDAVLGKIEDREYTVANLVQEIRVLNARGNDTIAEADFRTKLIKIMYPKDDELFSQYIFAEPDKAVDKIMGLTQFFLGVEPENIFYVVEAYWHPEKYEQAVPVVGAATQAAPAAVNPAATPSAPTPIKPVPAEEKKPAPSVLAEKKPVAPAPAAPKPAEAPAQKKPEKMDLIKVRQIVNSQFKKDPSGQYEDIAGVMEKLNALAEKYKDPKIADMLYFDEQAGAFKWIS